MKPTSGKIIVDGVDITAKDANLKEVRQKVGLSISISRTSIV